jgi:hypothetical protein
MEVMEGVPSGQVRTLLAIKEAIENAGVEFTGTPTENPGVCLITKARPKKHESES